MFTDVGNLVIKYSLNMKDKPSTILYRVKDSTLILNHLAIRELHKQ